MNLFEIIFAISFSLMFVGSVFYILVAVKPKTPEVPKLEFPKEFVIRILHETIQAASRQLSKEDQEYLAEVKKKREEEEQVKKYLDLNGAVNVALDKLAGKIEE